MAATEVYDTFAFAQVCCPTIKIFMITCSEHAVCMNDELCSRAQKRPWPLQKFMTLLHSHK